MMSAGGQPPLVSYANKRLQIQMRKGGTCATNPTTGLFPHYVRIRDTWYTFELLFRALFELFLKTLIFYHIGYNIL